MLDDVSNLSPSHSQSSPVSLTACDPNGPNQEIRSEFMKEASPLEQPVLFITSSEYVFLLFSVILLRSFCGGNEHDRSCSYHFILKKTINKLTNIASLGANIIHICFNFF